MSWFRAKRRRLAVTAALGAIFMMAFVGLVEYVGTGFLTDGSGAKTVASETATAPSDPDENGAPMSMHAAPKPVPELRFENGEGQPVTLADFQGKVVLLNVWATWCGPCREEMPTLDRLQAKLGGKDFEVLALSIDRAGIGVVNDFYDEIGIEHLAKYIDDSGKAARELGAVGLPTTLLLDRQGREIARHVGPAEWDAPEMVAFVQRHLRRESAALLPDAGLVTARGDLGDWTPAAPYRLSHPARPSGASFAIAKGNSS